MRKCRITYATTIAGAAADGGTTEMLAKYVVH
jgi:hypothetical protein